MALIDDMSQKIIGKGQKTKGKLRNDPIKGTIDQIKGTFNDKVADTKMRDRTEKDRNNSF